MSMALLFCIVDSSVDISITAEQIPEGVLLRERGEAGAKEGNKAIKRAVFDACKHVCAYHAHLKL